MLGIINLPNISHMERQKIASLSFYFEFKSLVSSSIFQMLIYYLTQINIVTFSRTSYPPSINNFSSSLLFLGLFFLMNFIINLSGFR